MINYNTSINEKKNNGIKVVEKKIKTRLGKMRETERGRERSFGVLIFRRL